MDTFKLTILLLSLTGVILAAPQDPKKSSIVPASPDVSETVVNGASKSVLKEVDTVDKLQTSDSFGLGYYVPYTAPVVTYPLTVPHVYNYYPDYYHSYRHHGYGGYGGYSHGYNAYNHYQHHGHGGFGYNVGVYHG